jgi:hypothetical protein
MYMKVIFSLFVVFVFSTLPLVAFQPLQYSDSVVVSLLTCEPGDAVYARFGHTALRIRDDRGRDMAYNYGIFDFRTSNFYWKFLRGHTDYLLGVYPTYYFLEEYQERRSGVWEQELDLTPAEKQRLIELLNTNYLPENRMYRYNFVFDNCATRPKVMVQDALEGIISYESQYASSSYRELINRYIHDDAWLSLGINLIFGKNAERPVNHGGAVFLPELLRDDLEKAYVVLPQDQPVLRKLVKNTTLIVGPFEKERVSTPWWIQPLFVASLALLWGLFLTFRKYKRSSQSKGFDTVLYSVTAMGGVIVLMLSFFSDHPLVEANWNILWLNPLNLIPAALIWKRSAKKFLLFFHAVNLSLMLVAGVVFAMQLQFVPLTVFPVILLLIVRTSRRLRILLRRYVEFSTSSGIKWKK